MKVVAHQHVGMHAQLVSLDDMAEREEEDVVVRGRSKDVPAIVAALSDVQRQTFDEVTKRTGHGDTPRKGQAAT
jgi:hypothetical protein